MEYRGASFRLVLNFLSLITCIHPAVGVKITGILPTFLKPSRSGYLCGVKEEGTLGDSQGLCRLEIGLDMGLELNLGVPRPRTTGHHSAAKTSWWSVPSPRKSVTSVTFPRDTSLPLLYIYHGISPLLEVLWICKS